MNASEKLFHVPMPVAHIRPAPLLFGFTGLSGSGKTTLLEEIIAFLCADGYAVSAIKHAHHSFDIDRRGKDSFRMREAGCREVMLVSDQRWALMREYRDEPEPSLDFLVERMDGVDIILVEGFRASAIPKIEVYRPSLGREPVWPMNASVCAIATDEAFDCPLPLLDLNEPTRMADFVKVTLRFTEQRRASL